MTVHPHEPEFRRLLLYWDLGGVGVRVNELAEAQRALRGFALVCADAYAEAVASSNRLVPLALPPRDDHSYFARARVKAVLKKALGPNDEQFLTIEDDPDTVQRAATEAASGTVVTASCYSNPFWEIWEVAETYVTAGGFVGATALIYKQAPKLLDLWIRARSLRGEEGARRAQFEADIAESKLREAQALLAQVEIGRRLEALALRADPADIEAAVAEIGATEAAAAALAATRMVRAVPDPPSPSAGQPVARLIDGDEYESEGLVELLGAATRLASSLAGEAAPPSTQRAPAAGQADTA